jgi:hypothetical protein
LNGKKSKKINDLARSLLAEVAAKDISEEERTLVLSEIRKKLKRDYKAGRLVFK